MDICIVTRFNDNWIWFGKPLRNSAFVGYSRSIVMFYILIIKKDIKLGPLNFIWKIQFFLWIFIKDTTLEDVRSSLIRNEYISELGGKRLFQKFVVIYKTILYIALRREGFKKLTSFSRGQRNRTRDSKITKKMLDVFYNKTLYHWPDTLFNSRWIVGWVPDDLDSPIRPRILNNICCWQLVENWDWKSTDISNEQ